jgi:hypothetical protein
MGRGRGGWLMRAASSPQRREGRAPTTYAGSTAASLRRDLRRPVREAAARLTGASPPSGAEPTSPSPVTAMARTTSGALKSSLLWLLPSRSFHSSRVRKGLVGSNPSPAANVSTENLRAAALGAAVDHEYVRVHGAVSASARRNSGLIATRRPLRSRSTCAAMMRAANTSGVIPACIAPPTPRKLR